jgi:DNA-binding CsgD family transcriptional regulator
MRKRLLPKRSTIGRYHHRNGLLTLREREVLCWLARGKSNAEIGIILGISSATVGKHLEHIYPKLGVENRTAAASFAFERETKRSPPPERPVGSNLRDGVSSPQN